MLKNIKTLVQKFEQDIGYEFKQKDLITNALIHPSFQNSSFEILEFIGDRVISLIIAKILFNTNPTTEKEYVHKFVSLTNRNALYQAGIYLKLDQYVLWTGHESHQKTIVEDATESVFGAIFVDAGMDFTQKLIQKVWAEIEIKDFHKIDPKTVLNIWANKQKLNFKYDLVKTSGPPHDRRYVVKLAVPNHQEIFGFGNAIRIAEKDAAEKFLALYTNNSKT